jgi:hypothetical protein
LKLWVTLHIHSKCLSILNYWIQIQNLNFSRQCFWPGERQLKYFQIYSKSNCELECLADFIVEICECVPFYFPRQLGTRICSFKDISCVNIVKRSKLAKCGCLPSCNSIEYKFEVSHAEINNQSISGHPEKYEIIGFIKLNEIFFLI